jgi:23S rRNA pseudouridine2605 synthase
MTNSKQNGRGKKYQDRQPGEKRPRTVKQADSRKVKPPRPGAKPPFSGADNGEARNNPDNRRRISSGGFKKESDREQGSSKYSKPGFTGKKYGKPAAQGGFEKKQFGKFEKAPRREFQKEERSPRFTKTDKKETPANKGYSREGNNTRFGQNSFSARNRRTEESNEVSTGNRPTKPTSRPAARKGPVRGKTSEERKFIKSTIKNADKNFKGSRKHRDNISGDLEKANLLTGEVVRLNRYIANSGLCSRREADVMIEQGLVLVNNKAITELGYKVNPGDEVKVDGRRITPEKPVYIVLNKPKGYITSTMDPEGRATVMDLLDLNGKERIYPIGRLDRNTTGVLLLTNDGEFAQKLMHPSFEIKKVYRVKLDRKPSKEHMLAWVNGVELEDGYMAFQQCGFVDKEDDLTLGVEIHSGRNRIVRRMFEHFNYEVVSLDRVLLGEFDHMKLGRGKWRFLNDKEIRYVERLKRMKGGKRKN